MKPDFVMVSYPRSGSGWLGTLLQSHPDLKWYGEVFNQRAIKEYKMFSHLQGWPTEPSQRLAFAAKLSEGHKWGFKALTFQINADNNFGNWWRLITNDIKMIHLRRCNHVESFVSLMKSQQNDVWQVRKDEDPSRIPKSIPVDVNTLLQFCQHREYDLSISRNLLRAYDVLEITYEELCALPNITTRRAEEFIGLTPNPRRKSHLQKTGVPLEEAIENYDEVKQALRTTRWGEFLRV
jgi:LPS sulfotransferase NodH